MAKFFWVLIAALVVVPTPVWSQPSEPALHEEIHLPEDEGSMSIQIPKLSVRGFLDVGYNATWGDDRRENTFAMGQLNLLLTSKLTERAYFLAETYFTNPDNNTQAYMLTRANVQYSISSLFNVRVGQVHTSVGYWNQIYHHGSYVQTTVSRPEIFRYDRAYVPIHSVGVELFGGWEGGAFDVRYTLGVFNGRGKVPPAVERVKDSNDAKGVAVLLTLSPRAVEGVTIGTTFYSDVIPPNPDLPATRAKSIGERIIGGHLVYKTNRVELLAELLSIYHDDHTSDQTYETVGWYVQGSYVVGSLTPYYRFDVLNFNGVDPYFAPNVVDDHEQTVGVRWDMMPWNALKVEYSFANYRGLDDEHTLMTNLSFAF